MSIDSYFCVCCLSCNKLTSIYDGDANRDYVKMFEYIFSLKPLQEDNETDCYICQECIQCLEDAYKFKTQVCHTLHILQTQGLIELNTTDGELIIKRAYSHSIASLEHDKDDKNETKDEKTNIICAYDVEVDVKNEYEQSFDTPKNKCAMTAITQPMLKVNVGPKVYYCENVDSAQTDHDRRHVRVKNQPVVENTHKSPIKREPEVIKSERERDSEMVVERNMNKVKSYEVTEDLTCKLCKKTMPNLYVYHTHMNGHMPHHICETCGKGFPNRVKLRRHNYSHQKGPFVCECCGESFTNYNTYCGHKQRNHSEKEQYACPQCTDRFRTFARRARHLHVAHGMQYKYSCQECGKTFLVAGTLSTHMRQIHRKEKRHTCALCDAAFFLQQDLVAHVGSAHGGEHAHMCADCGKRFPRRNALKVHIRTHTNEKPFSCALCDKKFTQKCALVAHIKVHSREKKPRGKILLQDQGNNQMVTDHNTLHYKTVE